MDEVEQISICNRNWAGDWVFQTRTCADLDQQWNYAGMVKNTCWVWRMSHLVLYIQQ